MATTLSLNSENTVWITTYFGGPDKGRCYDITMQLDEKTEVTKTFSEDALRGLLVYGQANGTPGELKEKVGTPVFDNRNNFSEEEAIERLQKRIDEVVV